MCCKFKQYDQYKIRQEHVTDSLINNICSAHLKYMCWMKIFFARYHLPTQRDTQTNMEVTRWPNSKPDWPCSYNNKWRRSLKDVHTCRGADAGSDHYLVVSRLKLCLRKAPIKHDRQRRYNIARLKQWRHTESICTGSKESIPEVFKYRWVGPPTSWRKMEPN